MGESAAVRKMLDVVRRVAPSQATVLIDGESGSGKELVAEAIHRWSRRREKPLVKVNCAAVPETLLEADLFGHERGAFTGAHRRRIGRLERAHGGTIFLDEIAQFSKSVQAKLLRVLQDGTFERLGGSQMLTTDVRVLAATHAELEAAVEQDAFRRDLYYRLNAVRVGQKRFLEPFPRDFPDSSRPDASVIHCWDLALNSILWYALRCVSQEPLSPPRAADAPQACQRPYLPQSRVPAPRPTRQGQRHPTRLHGDQRRQASPLSLPRVREDLPPDRRNSLLPSPVHRKDVRRSGPHERKQHEQGRTCPGATTASSGLTWR